jgi:hypothetical protein
MSLRQQTVGIGNRAGIASSTQQQRTGVVRKYEERPQRAKAATKGNANSNGSR